MDYQKKINDAKALAAKQTYILNHDLEWFKFRDGRNPPQCSLLGAIVLKSSVKDGTDNFFIPNPRLWYSLVAQYLNIDTSLVSILILGYRNKLPSSSWMKLWTTEESNMYNLGKGWREY